MKKFQLAILTCIVLLPHWLLAQPQLIGQLRFSGPQNGGAIYRLDQPGNTPGLIHTFNNLNPHLPVSGVCAGDEDWLYGSVGYNGTNSEGAAYRIRKDGTGFVKLFNFNSGSIARGAPYYHTDEKIYFNAENVIKVFDPATSGVTDLDPQGLVLSKNFLFDSDDYMYFSHSGDRLVKIKTDGTGYMELHQFDAGTEGANGEIGVTEIPGNIIFGVQKDFGSGNGGTIYSIHKDGNNFAVHHHFTDPSGITPESKLFFFDGKLFGTTSRGGNFGLGVLFAIDADGSNYRVLYHFESTLGSADPMGNIFINADGRIFGGYSQWHYNSSFIANRLWKIDTSGANMEQFYAVNQREHGHFNRGILLSNDTIFLATSEMGRHEGGALSRVDTMGNGAVALHNFGASANGFYPESGLIKGTDGKLYGTANIGGTDGNGIVYSLNISGTGFTKLHEFTDAEGYEPSGKLLEAGDGKIYGVCGIGGPTNTGCIYRMDKNGANFEIIYNFNNLNNGYWPVGGLVEGTGAVLYGMTEQGAGGPVIFRCNTNGSNYIVLKQFVGGELSGAQSGLIQYRGYLYGFMQSGGVAGQGGIFRIRTDGTGYQLMHEFNNTDGNSPLGSPTIATNGRIYGSASQGGTNGYGTLFSIDTAGTGFTVHRHLDFVVDGAYPAGQLIQGSDGLIYSAITSSVLSPGSGGIIARMNLDGSNFTIVKEFNSESEGSAPAWIMDLNAMPLPVQWTDFTARQNNQSVLLDWQTAQEQNTDRFIIERSGNATAFQSIGFVTAMGNTATGNHYSFTDPHPLNGDNYYRLKQTDKDGKFTYSKTVRISFEGRASITLSPNPALDNLTIKLPAAETVKSLVITDAGGRIVLRRGQANTSVITVPVQAFSKGIYWLQIETGQRTYRSSFMTR